MMSELPQGADNGKPVGIGGGAVADRECKRVLHFARGHIVPEGNGDGAGPGPGKRRGFDVLIGSVKVYAPADLSGDGGRRVGWRCVVSARGRIVGAKRGSVRKMVNHFGVGIEGRTLGASLKSGDGRVTDAGIN